MIGTATTNREPCAGCGCTDWVEGHFALGRLWCLTCWQGSQRPAVAMPPTPHGQQVIADWIAPRREVAQ
jgi:hypothetical protein